ncbi:polyphosphate kinase 2 family protein [Mucilaginibacter sp. UR6-1]|uniref:polyphosphate kinase 2 family protein n=1 Tax=Mucilaginibacter sp. UR6-1 TaxID=1435643 RepID=UPI001E2FB2A3|nr:polyphosphate kinase 2 family protein [Mucilaginibacter sp. UR6-1]MCC8410003.1 polyphosphate kinase 2 family protein [Mucilaginibacter sp. UR6-1]
MKNITELFKVTNGDKFSLDKYDTNFSGDYVKADADGILQDLVKQTAALQTALYAANSHSLLIIFQAMDAAGKDSAIAHTMSGLNPQGCQVYSFKQPSTEELDHDFLWRHYKALPERGRIGIHNRSHYENVLITKVHPENIVNEKLPGINSAKDINDAFWKQRYQSIRNFEKHLTANGTVVIKFFLHLSKKEQKERFLKRIADSEKNWKFSYGDIYERERWDDYMKAYEKAIAETATDECPWYVLPADKKWFTRIAISSIVLDTLTRLDLKYPELPEAERAKLDKAKAVLQAEKD